MVSKEFSYCELRNRHSHLRTSISRTTGLPGRPLGTWQSRGPSHFAQRCCPGVLIGLLRQLLRLSSLKMQHLSIFFVKDLVGRLNHLLKLDLFVIVGSLLPIFYLCPISSN